MSNARTGLWSAVCAFVGGVAGAFAGKAIVEYQPRTRYGAPRNGEVADGMTTGAATGAIIGAFIGGTVAGETTPPPTLPAK